VPEPADDLGRVARARLERRLALFDADVVEPGDSVGIARLG
jgi:hypothetical protein